MRIATLLIFVSIQTLGIISGVKNASGDDLHLSFENEVAGITPGMVILPKATGSLQQPGSHSTESKASKPGHSNKNQIDKEKSRKKIGEDFYANAGFISKNMVPVGKVAKLFDNKLGTSGPEKVFIDLGRRQGVETGDKFTVYSKERFIHHPVLGIKGEFLGLKKEWWAERPHSKQDGFAPKGIWERQGKPLGNRIVIRGVLEVYEVGDEFSYANVIKSYEDIKPGEFLIPYQENLEPFMDNSSDRNIEGYIVATKGDRIGVGLTDIVYVDKGWQEGVHAGQVFEVYRIAEIVKKKWWHKFGAYGTVRTPLLPEVLGELKIVNTQKHTATGVIVMNHYDMHVGNKIRIKR
ncbi:MAG: hypothetical protein VW455_05820 [Nitrospinota bacterium]